MISFDSTEHSRDLVYNPGDVLMVQPQNLSQSIEIALGALGYSDKLLDRLFYLKPNDSNISRPPSWLLKGECPNIAILINYV